MSNNQAQKQALALRDSFEFEPTSLVTYQSAGRVIVVGDDDALKRCTDLPASLNFELLSTTGQNLQIGGYMGAYVVEVTDQHGNSSTHKGDLILDLHAVALLTREMLPPGYIHNAPGSRDLPALTEELEGLRGEFQKPKYFDYDPSICAHAVNGKIACRQCIDACPAEAIQSIGERIEVNPYLCQGGGSCTTVCPSGAIRYLFPNLRDNGKRMRDTLREYLQQGGTNPIILFHSEEYTPDTYLQAYANVLPLEVEELASVGMDLCLSALAYGATQVVLHVDEQVPRSSSSNLQRQIDWIQSLLIGIGLDRCCVSLCSQDTALPEIDTPKEVEASILDMPQDKRSAIYQALNHLVAKLKPSADRVDLPLSAPFGEVIIDAVKCTLCMSCVGSCPGRALQDGSNREAPEVFFIESNCLQCAACVQTCPEDAITLKPRLLFDLETRNRARELNRDTPFACIACGKPFAPTSVIHKMQEKLKDHYMFSNVRALDRLKMCEDCRVVDIVQDADAMGGDFNPQKRVQ
jgi:ferredoxin